MRSRRRLVVVFALAAVGVLAVAGIAMAAVSSTVSFKFSPNKVPKSSYRTGKINIHTHTNYSDVGSQYTERTQLYFDSDFKVNANALGKCNKSSIAGTKTMKQAMATCGGKLIGKGTATAAAGANTVHACVLAFNGSGSGGHVLLFTRANAAPPFSINCANPKTNTQGNTNVLLDGKLSAAGKPGYGKLLDFNHIHAASPLPLTDFNVTVGKGVPGANNVKNWISAKCSRSNKTWKLQTKFTYNANKTQVINKTQTCAVG